MISILIVRYDTKNEVDIDDRHRIWASLFPELHRSRSLDRVARQSTQEKLMYAGHFALGLAIKAKEPRAPTWALLLGTGFLDVLFGIFVMLGIERVTMTPHASPGFSLDFIDWSHSLVMALVWAVVYSIPFWPRGRAVSLVLAFAVFSHFLLDFPMHPADLALWPHSAAHIGLGLWRRLPVGWWWVELAFIVLACGYYVERAKCDKSFGGRALWACAVVVMLHIVNSPWLSAAR